MTEVTALMPAAGRGERFDSRTNKLWVEIGGRPVLGWSLSAFENHPRVRAIVVAADEDNLPRVRRLQAQFHKLITVVPGGRTRAESVKRALDAAPGSSEILLVHDAARPAVSTGLIDRVIDGAERWGACIPALPISDTVKRVDGSNTILETVPREIAAEKIAWRLFTVQTPQGFRCDRLHRAYDHLLRLGGQVTDDSGLAEAAGIEVKVVAGEPNNVKLTNPADLNDLVRILAPRWARSGIGYDVHRLGADRPLVLGGVTISHGAGLIGHSDADVLIHAICDALLGAAALGDIGYHFPDDDEANRNRPSLEFLGEVKTILQKAGWNPHNVDATLLAEAPKVAPYRAEMQRNVAQVLGIDEGCVSIKATTSEKMGFVGRREGMACWAIATIIPI
ncbi:MAG: 2-C-methyl-D-erythritol 4-phosphate cytidylyltransferase [Armatimonadetes bacterium]|nr:2-C-methyl-D-erythritol 4-phosphate cytidylyltransferase [Armatimonadota bacterium]